MRINIISLVSITFFGGVSNNILLVVRYLSGGCMCLIRLIFFQIPIYPYIRTCRTMLAVNVLYLCVNHYLLKLFITFYMISGSIIAFVSFYTSNVTYVLSPELYLFHVVTIVFLIYAWLYIYDSIFFMGILCTWNLLLIYYVVSHNFYLHINISSTQGIKHKLH